MEPQNSISNTGFAEGDVICMVLPEISCTVCPIVANDYLSKFEWFDSRCLQDVQMMGYL